MTELRLRFIELTATSVEHWTVAGADDLDLARSDSVYIFVKYPGLSDGDLPCGGVSDPTKVLLTLSSVSGDPQSSPSRGNDISMA
jgi:hypothetical protein